MKLHELHVCACVNERSRNEKNNNGKPIRKDADKIFCIHSELKLKWMVLNVSICVYFSLYYNASPGNKKKTVFFFVILFVFVMQPIQHLMLIMKFYSLNFGFKFIDFEVN